MEIVLQVDGNEGLRQVAEETSGHIENCNLIELQREIKRDEKLESTPWTDKTRVQG